MDIGTLTGYLTLDDKMSPSLRQATDNMRSLGRDLTRAGTSLSLAVTAPLVGAAAAAVKFSATFEESMVRLTSIANVAGGELESVKKHILDLAPAVGIGPQELAAAMTKVSSTVEDTGVALQILDIAAQGAKAGFGETISVAGALTSVINSYGAENITAARAADIMAEAIKKGGAEAKELAPTLANVVPFASQLGVSFEEVSANIATMTKLGVPTSEAVTTLVSVFSALTRETRRGSEALATMGMSYAGIRNEIRDKGLASTMNELMEKFKGNLPILVDVFGRIEGVKNALGTSGAQAKTYIDVLDAIKHSSDGASGAMKEMADAMNGTQIFAWRQLVAQVQVAAIKLGDVLAPSLMKVLDAAKPVVAWVVQMIEAFAGLPQPVQTTTIAILGLVAAVGPVILFLGEVTSAIGALLPLFAEGSIVATSFTVALDVLSGPVGWLIGGIAAVTAALAYFGKANVVVDFFKTLGSIIARDVVLAFRILWDAAQVAWRVLVAIADVVVRITTPFNDTSGAMKELGRELGVVGGWLTKIGGYLVESAKGWQLLADTASKYLDKIERILHLSSTPQASTVPAVQPIAPVSPWVLEGIANEAAAAAEKAKKSQEEAITRTVEYRHKVLELSDALRGSSEHVQVFRDAFAGLGSVQKMSYDVLERIVPEIDKMVDAHVKLKPAEIAAYDAALLLRQGHIEQEQAILRTKGVTLEYIESQKDLGKTDQNIATQLGVTSAAYAIYTQKLEDARSITDDLAKSQIALAQARATMTGKGFAIEQDTALQKAKESFDSGLTSASQYADQRLQIEANYNAQHLALEQTSAAAAQQVDLDELMKRISRGELRNATMAQLYQMFDDITMKHALVRIGIAQTEEDRIASIHAAGQAQITEARKSYTATFRAGLMSEAQLAIAKINEEKEARIAAFKGEPGQRGQFSDLVEAQAHHQIDVVNQTYDTIEERMASHNVYSTDVVAEQARRFKVDYEQMADSGRYTTLQLSAAWHDYADAAVAAGQRVATNWKVVWADIKIALKGFADTLIQTFTSGGSVLDAVKALGVQIYQIVSSALMNALSTVSKALVTVGSGIASIVGGAVAGGAGGAAAGIAGSLGGAAIAAHAAAHGLFGMAAGSIGASVATAGLTMGIGLAAVGVVKLIQHFRAAHAEAMKVNDLRDEFVKGFEKIATAQQLAEAGGESWRLQVITIRDAYLATGRTAEDADELLQQLWHAPTVKAYEEAVKKVNEALALTSEIAAGADALSQAEEKYHLSLNVTGSELFRTYKILEAGQHGSAEILDAMHEDFQKMIDTAMKFGTAIPLQLKPMILELIDMGKLVDDNGDKLTDITKLNFTDVGTNAYNAFERMAQGIDRLVAVIKLSLHLALDETEQKLLGIGTTIANLPSPTIPTVNTVPQPGQPGYTPIDENPTVGVVDPGMGYNPVGGGPAYYAVGGVVPSYYGQSNVLPFRTRGTDVVPSMLTPEERVLTPDQNKAWEGQRPGRYDSPDSSPQTIYLILDGDVVAKSVVQKVRRDKNGVGTELVEYVQERQAS